MKQEKTRIISFEDLEFKIKEPQKTVVKEENKKTNSLTHFFATRKQKQKVSFAERTTRIKRLNPLSSYFPQFYKAEIKIAFYTSLFWLFAFLIVLAAISYSVYLIVTNDQLETVSIIAFLPIILITGGWYLYKLSNYLVFRSEAKTINFRDEKSATTQIKNLYKRLRLGYLSINWFSGLIYFLGLLTILGNSTSTLFLDTKKFHDITPDSHDGNPLFIIIFWSAVGVILLTMALQIVFLLWNYIRYKRIESFYNCSIVEEEIITQAKKQINRRNLIICFIIFICFFLLGKLIYKIIRRPNTTKVTVQS